MLIIAVALALFDPIGWTVLDETSALDGRRSYIAAVDSVGTVPNAIGQQAKATVALGCVDGRRSVSFIWPNYLGSDDALVRWKFDQGEVQRRQLSILRSGTTAFMDSRSADAFMTSMRDATTMVVEVSGYFGKSEAVFEVANADTVIDTLQVACPL